MQSAIKGVPAKLNTCTINRKNDRSLTKSAGNKLITAVMRISTIGTTIGSNDNVKDGNGRAALSVRYLSPMVFRSSSMIVSSELSGYFFPSHIAYNTSEIVQGIARINPNSKNYSYNSYATFRFCIYSQ